MRFFLTLRHRASAPKGERAKRQAFCAVLLLAHRLSIKCSANPLLLCCLFKNERISGRPTLRIYSQLLSFRISNIRLVSSPRDKGCAGFGTRKHRQRGAYGAKLGAQQLEANRYTKRKAVRQHRNTVAARPKNWNSHAPTGPSRPDIRGRRRTGQQQRQRRHCRGRPRSGRQRARLWNSQRRQWQTRTQLRSCLSRRSK